jgi:hypothetical protein
MTGWSTGAWGGARRGGRRRKSWSGCWGLFQDERADFTVKYFHEQLRKCPRRPLPGMLLHQDGSRHAWIEGLPAMDLIVTMPVHTPAFVHTLSHSSRMFLAAEKSLEASILRALLMVLPGRIELTTSPLPRGCSTTELRQQESGAIRSGAPEAGGNCHKGWRRARIVRPRSALMWPGAKSPDAGSAGRDGSRGAAVRVGLAPGPPGSVSPLP